jgi:hypothetical protein
MLTAPIAEEIRFPTYLIQALYEQKHETEYYE